MKTSPQDYTETIGENTFSKRENIPARDGKMSVLYIDDDAQNLTSFKAAFRRKYNVFTAGSGDEGFEILKNNMVHIIVADYRMPKMTGVQFFEEVLKQWPDSVRIILTGYADINGAIDAINKGEVFRYITKPWDEQELSVTLENAAEIYNTRKELKERNIQLRESYDELDRFVYSASHDLRAPLMSVLGAVKVAREEKEEIDLYLNLIERSVNKLSIFVNNIIDYHRNKKFEEEATEIDFKSVIEEILESYEFYEGKPDIEFKIQVEQNGSFICDINRLRIVLNNLISNAIKYHKKDLPGRYVRLDVKADNDNAAITIEDNGIGISEKHLDNIFQMFFRASHENAGSGIGLYIVKEVVKKMGGDIGVSSEEGKGTTFTLSIPNRNKAG